MFESIILVTLYEINLIFENIKFITPNQTTVLFRFLENIQILVLHLRH